MTELSRTHETSWWGRAYFCFTKRYVQWWDSNFL